MSLDKNKEIARRVTFDLFAAGNDRLLDELTSEDFRNDGQTEGPADGRANLANAIARVRRAFPDLEYTLEHEVAEGEFVVHHLRAKGTHRGPIGGVAPTGKAAVWREMHLMRFVAGRMVAQWGVVDRLGLLKQLGASPSPI